MLLLRPMRRILGYVRRRVFEQKLGIHFRLKRDERGAMFVLHRDEAFVRLFDNSVYDLLGYWRFAFFGHKTQSYESRLARITAIAHGLEKGLSFRNRKPVFGIANAKELISQLEAVQVDSKVFCDARVTWALSNLRDWHDHHVGKNEINAELLARCSSLLSFDQQVSRCDSTITLDRDWIQKEAKGDFRSVSHSRHSVRDFSEKPVDLAEVREAVSIATRTPSACNRQSVRIICLSPGPQMKAALALQNGNRGFSESVDKLLIVTFDRRCYLEHNEQNLGFVDAGMFAMSLIHALHFLGLGSCCLNWAVDRQTDNDLHDKIDVPKHLAVACMIAVGHLPEQLRVAASHRLPVDVIVEVRSATHKTGD